MEGSEELMGYCGVYCSSCGIYQGRIKQAAENLRKVISNYGFDRIAPRLASSEPAFQNYAEFEKVLDAITHFFEDVGVCPGCVNYGGDLDCAIRKCCKGRYYTTCSECIEMDTCEKLITTPLSKCRLKALEAVLNLQVK